MAVSIQLNTDALEDPAVARAVARLMSAIGRPLQGDRHRGPGTEPSALRAPHGPATALARSSHPTWTRGMPPVLARQARSLGSFLAALPPRSRDFLELLERRGTLGLDEAMAALGVAPSKALGGLTGSIARWAPVHGVNVPFEATLGRDGKRAWRWIGTHRATTD